MQSTKIFFQLTLEHTFEDRKLGDLWPSSGMVIGGRMNEDF